MRVAVAAARRRAALAACSAALWTFAAADARADTLVVPEDFASIQAAIDAAEPADTVLVEPGTYRENLELVSNVDVRGRETARTLLGPDDPSAATISITGATAVRVSNLTLIDAETGISVNASSGVEIANVVFDRVAGTGLAVDGVSGVSASNNVFFENETAIGRGSANTVVESNIFRGNAATIESVAQPGVDPAANVLSNCFSANDDLSDTGSDGGFGVGATTGNPLFVAPADRDFHLQEDSPCIDAGRGSDVIDNTTADAGVYGGPFADAVPFPVNEPSLAEVDGDESGAAIDVSWPPNLDYRVTNAVSPGGYLLYYEQGGDGSPPLEGTDAGGGTMPSPIDVGAVTSFTLEGLDPQTGSAPLAPRLVDAEGRNEAAIVEWEASAGATGYRVWYGVNDVTDNVEDVGDVTSATVSGLGNDTTYRFAVSAVNQPRYHVAVAAYDNTQNRNESELSEVAALDIGAALESPLSGELTATPGATEPYPPLPDEGCFVATAAFGADWEAEVRVLRAFRDRYLLAHPPGRWLVGRYYAYGPHGAAYLNEHEALKPLARAALLPWVGLAFVLLEAPWVAALLAAAVVGAAFARSAAGSGATARVVRAAPGGRRPRGGAGAGAEGSSRRSTAVPWTGTPGALPAPLLAALLLALQAASSPAGAQPPGAPPTDGTRPVQAPSPAEADARFSPRWMYELKGGYYYPDLDRYEHFYGDDRVTVLGVAGSWRARDWLEIGAEVGHLRDKGFGTSSATGEPGGDVTLRLVPLQVFASFIWQPEPERRFVPYAGIGVAGIWYEQDVELESGRDGRTDVGAAARAGLRFLIGSEGPRPPGSTRRNSTYWRSYVFIEAQHIDADVEGFGLGGESYQLGFRVEFELGR